MQWSDILWHPPTRTLRQFAAIAVGICGGLAGAAWYWRSNVAIAALLLAIALALGCVGIIRPLALRPIWIGLLVVTFPIGWLVSLLAMALVFYGLFAPLGLFFKLIGRDALQRRFEPERASYWTTKPTVTDIRGYFRQS